MPGSIINLFGYKMYKAVRNSNIDSEKYGLNKSCHTHFLGLNPTP
ncbi:hypothetical protein VVMO6_01031 [Vibrio vulnificus MO6-24/O]|nr:hypothetical protein VVMO6_01031 [Vibrio vulnificus MO6-24/O]